jgi:hypothetical protein
MQLTRKRMRMAFLFDVPVLSWLWTAFKLGRQGFFLPFADARPDVSKLDARSVTCCVCPCPPETTCSLRLCCLGTHICRNALTFLSIIGHFRPLMRQSCLHSWLLEHKSRSTCLSLTLAAIKATSNNSIPEVSHLRFVASWRMRKPMDRYSSSGKVITRIRMPA